MWTQAMSLITDIFKPVSQLIDNLHTSGEEKIILRNELAKLQNEVTTKQIELLGKQMDIEKELIKAQADVIKTETSSSSWITSNWRPLTMLIFVGIIVLHSLKIRELSPEFAADFMELVKWGLGGYVVGRSAEKVAPAVAKAVSNK